MKKLVLLLCLIGCLTACKKTQTTPGNLGCRITSANIDSINMQFGYNGQGEITTVSTTAPYVGNLNYNLTYSNGQVTAISSNASGASYTTNYTYNSSGLITSIVTSIGGTFVYGSQTFEYGTGTKPTSSIFYNQQSGTDTIYYTWANDNIVTETRASGSVRYYTYGTKKSPFSFNNFSSPVASVNNIVTEVSYYQSFREDSSYHSYVFNGSDYPTTDYVSTTDYAGDVTNKINTYTYTGCN
jgi:YD repeat-containing protein